MLFACLFCVLVREGGAPSHTHEHTNTHQKIVTKGPQRLNPGEGVSMPPEVIAVHGITWADLEGAPRFADVAHEWRDWLAGCDLLGYHIKRYDLPLLRCVWVVCLLCLFEGGGCNILQGLIRDLNHHAHTTAQTTKPHHTAPAPSSSARASTTSRHSRRCSARRRRRRR